MGFELSSGCIVFWRESLTMRAPGSVELDHNLVVASKGRIEVGLAKNENVAHRVLDLLLDSWPRIWIALNSLHPNLPKEVDGHECSIATDSVKDIAKNLFESGEGIVDRLTLLLLLFFLRHFI